MKKTNKSDPHADREANRYEHPVPSREYILEYLQQQGVPTGYETLCKDLKINNERDEDSLKRRLRAMERDGQLISNRRNEFGLINRMNLVCGRVVGHRDGYGFLIPEEGGNDLFLSARQMRQVFDGDKALARIAGIDPRGRLEGAIVEVLESNTQYIVGRFFIERGIAFVVPDSKRITQDIIIPEDEQGLAKAGQIVTVKIIKQPTTYSRPIGAISEILGDHMAPGMEIDIAMRSHKLPHEWPEAIKQEIAHIKKEIPASAYSERQDLRHLPLVTIDGEDARDFDDAVYCESRPRGGWHLYVAIADVSYYIQEESELDNEARMRGNSVYFPGQVIPMLPEIFSNGLCSLNPDVDRLCMVCEMSISAEGKLMKSQFYPAVMHSKARLTYTQVNQLIQGDSTYFAENYPKLIPHLEELYRLFKILYQGRLNRGAIEFETIETKVIFGKNRKIEQIIPIQRNDAHRLIEECMLMANVATAKYLLKNKIPTLFRVHNGPNTDKLQDLRHFLSEFGLQLQGEENPTPADYAQLLKKIQGRRDAHLIQTVMLRSLSQAVYTPENKGHFGLAFNAYTHFTSPIRRYPDLLIHRAIRHLYEGKSINTFSYNIQQMMHLGEQCSLTERRADEAVREALDWLKCEYMQDKVGEEFDGVISSIAAFGIFVMLTSVYVEGLVHVTALNNDYYHYDPAKMRLIGERTGISYRLGDSIRVRIARVNLDTRQIDFELITSQTPVTPKPNDKQKIKKTKKKTTHPLNASRSKKLSTGKSGTGNKRLRKRRI
ncbi:MAG: Ribonuclease R [Legionellaceae bacterium]